MSLVPGTRVGPYEIVSAIGAGGMGEVYRARDTTLQRDVAIKILPSLFARDQERLARFEREARTLAALNHPHVGQVYGTVDLPAESGGHGLVLEFVDGDDLAERLAHGGAVLFDEAIPIALQIAEAIEAAHDLGIIHRDLKPSNIKLRADGQIKVLDFGLAKALLPADVGGANAGAALANSPTITSPFQMSQVGVILGTAAYMAPEQAKGKPLDKRVDIWAFGCVLYELLTAQRAFRGDDVTDTLAAIVRADPDWKALPPDTPAAIRTLLRRCLVKDPRERLPDIGAARLELKEAVASAAQPGATIPVRAGRGSMLLPWALFAAAAVVALAAIASVQRGVPAGAAPDARVYKALIMPPSPLAGAPALRFQVSPDGRKLAFVAPDEVGRSVLWVRPLDAFAAQPLVGTGNASAPFWSSDSRWVGFTAEGKLKKVETATGTVLTICDATTAPPATWNADGVILFTTAGGLSRVSAAGGTPVQVTRLGPGERVHIAPFFLPDGRHFLYSASAAASQRATVMIGSLDSAESTHLLDLPSNAMYADGRLLFLHGTTLVAQPFDPVTRALSGAPVPVAEDLQINSSTGTGAFSVSQAGELVYQTGASAGTQLTWFDRAGKQVGSLGQPQAYRDVQLSPDARFASVTVSSSTGTEVWLLDVGRNLPRRFTFGSGGAASAVWSPDGRFIVYAARRTGTYDIFRKVSGGGGSEELLLHDDKDKLPLGFASDGRTLLYRVPRGSAAGELWLLPIGGANQPRPFMPGNTSQVPAAVSPDGRWVAYVSEESSRREVYVTSFPGANGKWQVSTGGGDNPIWRTDGKELFFSSEDRLMAVDIAVVGTQFDTAAPRALFDVRVPSSVLASRSTYAVSRDGQRFLVNTWDPRAALTPITLVVNWTAALR
ncbi:MAG: protein kinase [Vicinamibacterales bacterium]